MLRGEGILMITRERYSNDNEEGYFNDYESEGTVEL